MGIRTKIVATLGPERPIHGPDDQPDPADVPYHCMVPWFVKAGVDVFRLNLSHRSPGAEREYQFLEAYRDTRHLWERQGRHVAIMGDLQGPKIRLGNFYADANATVELVSGKAFLLHTRQEVRGSAEAVTVLYEAKPFAQLAAQVKVRDQIWLGDGEALLEVRQISRRGGVITCHIHSGGALKGGR